MNNGEYSTLQKDRICNHILEMYKDGKYMFDTDAKRQSNSHYTKKSEIMKGIDKWIRQDDFIKYIVPILDYNLECDYDSLEKEWDKNHRMAIKVEDTENKYKKLEEYWDSKVKEGVKEKMKTWVSDKEDVAQLILEKEEADNRHKERIRRHMMAQKNSERQINQLQYSLKKIEDQNRENRIKEIEGELDLKTKKPGLQKQIKRLERQNNKLEKDLLTSQKKKMDIDMKFLSLKAEHENMKSELITKNQQLQIQVDYFKVKDSVQQEAQLLLHHPQQEEEEEEEEDSDSVGSEDSAGSD